MSLYVNLLQLIVIEFWNYGFLHIRALPSLDALPCCAYPYYFQIKSQGITTEWQ